MLLINLVKMYLLQSSLKPNERVTLVTSRTTMKESPRTETKNELVKYEKSGQMENSSFGRMVENYKTSSRINTDTTEPSCSKLLK